MQEDEFKDISLEELEAAYSKEDVADYVLSLLSKELGISTAQALKDFKNIKEMIHIGDANVERVPYL